MKNLKFTKLTQMILVEGTPSTDVILENLQAGTNSTSGDAMTEYGVFAVANGLTITNCHIYGAYSQHGFRTYASDVAINNCSLSNARATGFWTVNGSDVLVDGFTSTDRWCRVGPNNEAEAASDRLTCVEIKNVTITGSDPDDLIKVELGTIGCHLENIDTPQNSYSLEIGRNTPFQVVSRPLDRVHWDELSDLSFIANHSCIGADVGPCEGDVDNDGVVNVIDLLAIINAWGCCATGCAQVSPPTCASPTTACQADIHPVICGDAVVNVLDLLLVISDWGCSPTQAGSEANAPKSLDDCWDTCTASYPPAGSHAWHECYDRCVETLCATQTIPDCD